jgi:hypothetical protein
LHFNLQAWELVINYGTKNMRDVIKQMKSDISKEEDKVINTSEGLEGNWKQF